MLQPAVGEPFQASPDVHVIPTYWPIPNVGVIPMNAFVVHAAEPVLVDTGVQVLTDDFVAALASVLPLDELRWIWLSHDDRDHTGNLHRLLDLAPRATVATPFLAIGRTLPERPFPLDRLQVLNAGDVLDVGDRRLRAWRPPLFDSPATVGFLDELTGTLFTSDCFGAPLPTVDEARARDVAELDPAMLAQGQLAWATVDTPWVSVVDRGLFAEAVEGVRAFAPSSILSSHLPPVRGAIDQVIDTLHRAPEADPVPGATQAELGALLASFAPA